MEREEIKNIIEALLLSEQGPLDYSKMLSVFEEWQKPTREELDAVLCELQMDYHSRSFELVAVAGGYRLQTKSAYSVWVSRLQSERPAKYSRALLETLAIIAYKQPVTRGDIEEVRGVAVNSQIIKTLLEREWIRVAGYKDVPGKPAVYTTTKTFLDYFNLVHLRDLPPLPEIVDTLVNQQEAIVN